MLGATLANPILRQSVTNMLMKGFQLDMKENWEKVTMITIDDKLEALR